MMAADYEGPAIVEIMGHRRLAGFVSEVEVAGAKMIRVDVPSDPPATQFYGGSAIFCLTPCTEETMREAVAAMRVPEPVHRWELPRAAGGPAREIPAGRVESGQWVCDLSRADRDLLERRAAAVGGRNGHRRREPAPAIEMPAELVAVEASTEASGQEGGAPGPAGDTAAASTRQRGWRSTEEKLAIVARAAEIGVAAAAREAGVDGSMIAGWRRGERLGRPGKAVTIDRAPPLAELRNSQRNSQPAIAPAPPDALPVVEEPTVKPVQEAPAARNRAAPTPTAAEGGSKLPRCRRDGCGRLLLSSREAVRGLHDGCVQSSGGWDTSVPPQAREPAPLPEPAPALPYETTWRCPACKRSVPVHVPATKYEADRPCTQKPPDQPNRVQEAILHTSEIRRGDLLSSAWRERLCVYRCGRVTPAPSPEPTPSTTSTPRASTTTAFTGPERWQTCRRATSSLLSVSSSLTWNPLRSTTSGSTSMTQVMRSASARRYPSNSRRGCGLSRQLRPGGEARPTVAVYFGGGLR